jgi:hypothetical protein
MSESELGNAGVSAAAEKTHISAEPLKGEISAEIRADYLGALLGYTTRHLTRLRDQGVLKSRTFGLYLFPESIRAWGDHREALGYERACKEFSTGLSGDEPLPPGERVKVERARALQLKNDAVERLTITMPEALETLDAMVGMMKTFLTGIPARFSDDVSTRRALERSIDAGLAALSQEFDKAQAALASGIDTDDPTEADDG